MTYAGMIRGSTAFALVLRIPYEGDGSCNNLTEKCMAQQNYDVLVSSILMLVMATTLIFGTFMGKVQKILVPSTKEDREEYEEHIRTMSAISKATISRKKSANSIGEQSSKTHYEELIHPNE